MPFNSIIANRDVANIIAVGSITLRTYRVLHHAVVPNAPWVHKFREGRLPRVFAMISTRLLAD